MADAQQLQRGQRFRGLLVNGALGTGAMGAAYLASHPVLRSSLVVKLFNTPLRHDLAREARLAARVRSHNVVEVLDAGEEDGVPFIIQRYVDGIDLAELLARVTQGRGFLPIEVVAGIGVDIANGLHALHRVGVVHRDVKPANLFLSGDGWCAVGDLGLAVDPTRDPPDGAVAGTPQFMAPEQWLGATVDARADLYGLGCVLHTLASGSFAFEGTTLVELAEAHCEHAYAPPEASSPEQAYFFAVLRRLLEKDPSQRWATAQAVAEQLAKIATPRPALERGADWAVLGDVGLSLRQGDMAQVEADVLVNAANWRLRMDVGVSAALKRGGGASLEAAALAQAPRNMGDVVWTDAGRLRARWVAHAVAALDGAICIQRCVLRALLAADARGARSIAFPALGTGVGDVSMSHGAYLMLDAIRTFAWLRPCSTVDVRIVLFDEDALDTWKRALQSL